MAAGREVIGDEWNVCDSQVVFTEMPLGLCKIHDPNGKQHVLNMVNFSRKPTDFRDEFPSAKSPNLLEGGTSRGSSGTIPCPSGRQLWQLGSPPCPTTVFSIGNPTLNLHFLPVTWGGQKTTQTISQY